MTWSNLCWNGVVDTVYTVGAGWGAVGGAVISQDATRAYVPGATKSLKVVAAASGDAAYHRFIAPKGGATVGAWIYPTTALTAGTLTIRTDANGTIDAVLDKSLTSLPLNQWTLVQGYWPEGKLTPGTAYRAYLRLAGAATLWVDQMHVYAGRPGEGGQPDASERPMFTMRVATTPGLAPAALIASNVLSTTYPGASTFDDSWRVRGFSVRMGRSFETEQPDVGQWSVELDNADGAWDPDTGSRAVVGSGVLLTSFYRGERDDLMLGQIWDVTPNLTGPNDQTVQVSGSCLLKALGMGEWDPRLDFGVASGVAGLVLTDSSKTWVGSAWVGYRVGISSGTGSGGVGTIVASGTSTLTVDAWVGGTPGPGSSYEIVPNEETANARIARVLQSQGLFGAQDSTSTTVAAIGAGERVNALEHLRQCAATDGGRLWTDPAVGIRFQGRAARRDAGATVPTVTLGNGAGEVPMAETGAALSDALLYNDVKATSGSSSSTVQDASSISKYGKRSLSIDTILGPSSISQLADAAGHYLGRFASPKLRMPSATPQLGALSGALLVGVLGLVSLQLSAVSVKRPIAGGASVAAANFWVDGYSVSGANGQWQAAFDISPLSGDQFWVLDSTTRSQLDTSTRLAW